MVFFHNALMGLTVQATRLREAPRDDDDDDAPPPTAAGWASSSSLKSFLPISKHYYSMESKLLSLENENKRLVAKKSVGRREGRRTPGNETTHYDGPHSTPQVPPCGHVAVSTVENVLATIAMTAVHGQVNVMRSQCRSLLSGDDIASIPNLGYMGSNGSYMYGYNR
mmetsp:Transcript_17076/g.49307  ORF Transcript_17076/g.49307 Transcript_17076/m.49307 type:complete len:167 (+) Transcript_17076:1254-1754(+)